jgi:hypothetical protein
MGSRLTGEILAIGGDVVDQTVVLMVKRLEPPMPPWSNDRLVPSKMEEIHCGC